MIKSQELFLAMGGEAVSTMLDGQYSYPIVLRLAEKDRSDLARIRELLIHAPGGDLLRLGDLAEVSETRTPSNINRENVSRRIVVQHNVAGRALGDVVADVERALAPVRARLGDLDGYRIHISGQFEAQQAATKRILILSLLSLAVMVLVDRSPLHIPLVPPSPVRFFLTKERLQLLRRTPSRWHSLQLVYLLSTPLPPTPVLAPSTLMLVPLATPRPLPSRCG